MTIREIKDNWMNGNRKDGVDAIYARSFKDIFAFAFWVNKTAKGGSEIATLAKLMDLHRDRYEKPKAKVVAIWRNAYQAQGSKTIKSAYSEVQEKKVLGRYGSWVDVIEHTRESMPEGRAKRLLARDRKRFGQENPIIGDETDPDIGGGYDPR